jgi:hypothetical protein
MNVFVHHFLIGACAAAAFEVLRLYEYRHELSSRKYARLMKSALFWLVALGMVAASGFFAWAFYAGRGNVTVAELALSGVAARSLVRQGVGTLSAKSSVKLGSPDDGLSLRDVLR